MFYKTNMVSYVKILKLQELHLAPSRTRSSMARTQATNYATTTAHPPPVVNANLALSPSQTSVENQVRIDDPVQNSQSTAINPVLNSRSILIDS
uniref:Uncharacterized protein n=1 Tax=Cannabis sativa TaxID=3483 RepID=A0A803Q119_CANSA